MNTMREVGVGPFGGRHRRMEDMVDAVDHYRRLLLAEVENAFDPQQVLAAHAAKMREPVRNRHPVERFVEREHEAGDRCIVAVMGVMAMIGVVVVIVRRLPGSCERLLVEPAPNVDRFFLGIDQAGTE